MLTLIKEVLLSLMAAFAAIASWVIPKASGLVVFYPTHQSGAFEGNLRAVFREMSTRPGRHRPLWLTSDEGLAAALRREGFAASSYRRHPLWLLLRAETIWLDGLAPYLGGGRFRLVQLWHGSGFKQIGLANMHRRGLRRARHRWQYETYDFITASSHADQERKRTCFGNSRVFLTGAPRTDDLVRQAAERQDDAKKALGLPGYSRVISYCPTFRETAEGRPFSRAFWGRLDRLLESTNSVFVIKRHPRDGSSPPPSGLQCVVDLSREIKEVDQLLSITDLLISDYSSVATDFSLLNRPYFFYTYDLESYTQTSRGLFYDLETVLPGPFALHEKELLARLADLCWWADPGHQRRHARFQAQFHSFTDGRSTERVLNAVFGPSDSR